VLCRLKFHAPLTASEPKSSSATALSSTTMAASRYKPTTQVAVAADAMCDVTLKAVPKKRMHIVLLLSTCRSFSPWITSMFQVVERVLSHVRAHRSHPCLNNRPT